MSRNERPHSQNLARQKSHKKPQRQVDARVRRTRARLGDALVALIQEKPFNDVTVQEVLDRALVGRSTFYLHFRDKNDLLLSQLETFLEMMSTFLSIRNEESHRVLPVTEMFAHIGAENKIYRALADAGRLNDFFDLAQGYFARAIEQRLRESRRCSHLPQHCLGARSYALAASLLALLKWWVDHGAKKRHVQWTTCSTGWFGRGFSSYVRNAGLRSTISWLLDGA
jgi:AcrR family transcriptional regulator